VRRRRGLSRRAGVVEGLGCARIGEEIGSATSSRRVRPGHSEGDDKWGPLVSGCERRAWYRFGKEGKWAVGSFSSWAGLLPRGPFCFSISFLFFPCFSFVIFAKHFQNDFKL
jgi:hypothetical protein